MKVKDKIKYAMYLALFTPLSWLPLRALYWLSDVMYLFIYRIGGYRTEVVRENLRSCYPDKDAGWLRRTERRFYHQLCDNFMETIKLLCISDRQMRRRMEVKGTDLLADAARRGHPIVAYLGHYCNWEWVPSVAMWLTEPKVACELYKPLHDKAFDRLMLKVRSRFGTLNIDKNKAFRELLRMRRDLGTFLVGFIADGRSNADGTPHHAMFLRHDTMFYPGGEEIGNRINAEYMYVDVRRVRRGHYTMEFIPITVDNAEAHTDYPVTRKYLQMLQDTIDRDPAYWLWSHRRWI